MRLLFLIAPIFLLCSFSAQPNRALIIDFVRNVEAPGQTRETVSGVLYFQAPQSALIEVTKPVHQWMVFKKQELLLYYPEEKKGFRISSRMNPLTLPFVSAFAAASQENYGMPELGFTVSSVQNKGDSITTMWLPPKPLQEFFKSATMVEVNGRLVMLGSTRANGDVYTRAIYKSHTKLIGSWFPMEMYSGYQNAKGWTQESVVFSKPRSQMALADSLVNFKFAPGTTIKEVQW